jgi:small-conductance mechanosensitive channel
LTLKTLLETIAKVKFQPQLLHSFLQIETYFAITTYSLSSWGFYRFFLRNISAERHKRLGDQLLNLLRWWTFFSVFFLAYWAVHEAQQVTSYLNGISPYLGVVAFIAGSILFIKTSKLLLLEYLFFNHLKEGVPLLLVNIFTLILSFAYVLWALSYFLGIDIAPLLATSAALSLVLGLALQDTLGNLFAGISLQLDKAFEIGDWIEVYTSSQKITGQVSEITWRSTTLVGWFNEIITLPNRVLASHHINNYKKGELALYRSQSFRLPHQVPVEEVRQILISCVRDLPQIRHDLPVNCLVVENHDSWLLFRLSYAIEDFAAQFHINHEITRRALNALKHHNIALAHQVYHIEQV